MATIYAGIPCIDPARLEADSRDRDIPTQSWLGKANSFAWGNGREPGAGHILLRRGDLDAIDLTTDHDLQFIDDEQAAPPLKRITLIRAECVTPGADGDPLAAYLCHLRDRRWHLARTGTTVRRVYNLRLDNSNGDADVAARKYVPRTIYEGYGLPWTWQQVVQSVQGNFFDPWKLDLGPVLTLPFTPDGTPENLDYRGWRSWDALNDVLDRLACTLAYDPTTDTFSVQRLGDVAAAAAVAAAATLATLGRNELRTWDTGAIEPSRGKRPEKIQVLFPTAPPPTQGVPRHYAVVVTLAGTAADLAGVEPNTYEVLHDDLTAETASVYTDLFPPSNLAALTSRANERAADWLRKRTGYEARSVREWQGFQPKAAALLAGTAATVAFDDRGGVMRTALKAEPDGALERWRAYERPFSLGPDWGGDFNTFSDTGVPRVAPTATPVLHGPGSLSVVLGTTVTRLPDDGVYLVHAAIAVRAVLGNDGGTTGVNQPGAEVAVDARLVTVWADDPCTVIFPGPQDGWRPVVDYVTCGVAIGFAGSPPAAIYKFTTSNPTTGQWVVLGQGDPLTRLYGGGRGVMYAWQVRLRLGGTANANTTLAADLNVGLYGPELPGGAVGGTWIAFRRNSYDAQPTPRACWFTAGSVGSGGSIGPGSPPPPPPPPMSVACDGLPAPPFFGGVPRTIAFTCAADGGVPPYTYAWVFWDGNTNATQSPAIYFTTGVAGGYAYVIATDSLGASATCAVGPYSLG